jgi:branched-chain amino acid transport system ATP-binding protein
VLLHDSQATQDPKPRLEPAMRCEFLAKSFGALKAVDEVSFQVPRGAVLGIGGPNGAGKTTFFDLISGVQSPTSGRIWINDQEMTNKRADSFCRAGVARTFQQDVAFDSMTAVENVRVAAYFGRGKRRVPGLLYDTQSYHQAIEALNTVGLSGKAHEIMGNMPVLDRKLVMLAGAIVTDPDLLLMDEPVGGLIPAEIEIFEKIVGTVLQKGRTLVIIEHVMSFLLKVSDRMLIMHEGRIIFDGLKGAMLNDENVVSVYLGKTAAGMLRKEFGGGGPK